MRLIVTNIIESWKEKTPLMVRQKLFAIISINWSINKTYYLLFFLNTNN